MLWAIVFCSVIVMKVSNGWPISAWSDTALAYDVTSDYFDGPWGPDYYRGGRFPGMKSAWPFDRYGSYWGGDGLDPYYSAGYGPGALDYAYYNNGYPKTAEVAKENYIRDNPHGGTEVGIRDSVSMRSGPWRSGSPYLARSGWRGLDRFYNPGSFSDYDYLPFSPYRRPFPMSAARPSSLRWGGDATYLRR